ncbi:MAG: stage III sporulation AC/AD family protein [Candidatus Faecousia sp.]|nr:stage III sporulation AC/AD family protein [Candidatus Faecousia sp.]
MELFWKSLGVILTAALLELALKKQEKDLAVLLTVGVIAMAAAAAMQLLKPVQALLEELRALGNLKQESLTLLFKAAGLGLSSELGSLVCADAGNEALAKLIRFLGSAAIVCLSVPMFTALLDCIVEMVGVS